MALPARRPRRPLPPSTRKRPVLLWACVGFGVAVVAALVVVLAPRSSEKPPIAKPSFAQPQPQPSSESVPTKPRNPVDDVIAECASLVREGRFKEAVDKFDWFPARGLSEADAARLTAARTDIQKKATEFVETRAKKAESDAAKGLLQAAVKHLEDTADFALPVKVGEAYQLLRDAADGWLQAQRAESKTRIKRELAELTARLAVAPSPDPEAAWKRAFQLMEGENWIEAIDVLSALAGVPAEREKALLARAQAHHGAERHVGVLLDARLLLESGKSVDMAVGWLNRAITRAPIDETVFDLYEREINEKKSLQPRVWMGLIDFWTWRHDLVRASETYMRAVSRRVPFTGPEGDAMTKYKELAHRGFPPGNPVIVDYAGPYEILTDAKPERVRKLALQLESIAKEYGAGFKYSVNPNFRFRVMFFTKDVDYRSYYKAVTGQDPGERGIIAYYSPSIKQLVVCDSRPGEFLETVRHEAFHQFLDYFTHNAPRWFNEGSASFFEKSTFGRPEFNPNYQADLPKALKLKILPSLKELLLMPVEKWVGDPREGLFYKQSWSFIYWLHKQGKGGLWNEYLRLLVLGHPGGAAFERVFSGKLDELEREWNEAAQSGRYGD